MQNQVIDTPHKRLCDRWLRPGGHSDPVHISASDSSVHLSRKRDMWNSNKTEFLSANTDLFLGNTATLQFRLTLQYEQNLTRPVGQPADEALRTHTHKAKYIARCARCRRGFERTNSLLR